MSHFYTDKPSDCLRLGDVVSGFSVVTPKSDQLVENEATLSNVVITVNKPRYLVVMTPCCSIEAGVVVLAPLNRVRPAFFKNPHFAEDLTRINRKVSPQNSMPPERWNQLAPADKTAKLGEDAGYVFLDCFIYEPNQFLSRYTATRDAETGHYMVDFKAMYRFECGLIKREKKVAPIPEGCNKLLQLAPLARQELRDKLTYFFSRIPDEDRGELL